MRCVRRQRNRSHWGDAKISLSSEKRARKQKCLSLDERADEQEDVAVLQEKEFHQIPALSRARNCDRRSRVILSIIT